MTIKYLDAKRIRGSSTDTVIATGSTTTVGSLTDVTFDDDTKIGTLTYSGNEITLSGDTSFNNGINGYEHFQNSGTQTLECVAEKTGTSAWVMFGLATAKATAGNGEAGLEYGIKSADDGRTWYKHSSGGWTQVDNTSDNVTFKIVNNRSTVTYYADGSSIGSTTHGTPAAAHYSMCIAAQTGTAGSYTYRYSGDVQITTKTVTDEKASLVTAATPAITGWDNADGSGAFTLTSGTGITVSASSSQQNTWALYDLGASGQLTPNDNWVCDYTLTRNSSDQFDHPMLMFKSHNTTYGSSSTNGDNQILLQYWANGASTPSNGSNNCNTRFTVGGSEYETGAQDQGGSIPATGTTLYYRVSMTARVHTMSAWTTSSDRTAGSTDGTRVVHATGSALDNRWDQSDPLRYIMVMHKNGVNARWTISDFKFWNATTSTSGTPNVAFTFIDVPASSDLPANTLFEETDTKSTWWLQSNKWKGTSQPLAISDLWSWWKAESQYMTLNGSGVTVWNPQINTTPKKLIADSAGVEPTFEANGRNGRGIVKFDGTEVMHTNDDSYRLTQPLTFVIVMKFPTAVDDKTIFDADNTGNRLLHRNTGTAGTQLEMNNGATFTSTATTQFSASWGYEVLVFNGSSSKWRINGVDVKPGTFNPSDDFNPITIASDYRALNGGSNNAVMDVMHFIIYDKALSDSEITDIEEWCASEVGT